jgi:hypothetical protein
MIQSKENTKNLTTKIKQKSLDLHSRRFGDENNAKSKNKQVKSNRQKKNLKKVPVVLSNTFSGPNTMMVHFQNTHITIIAVSSLIGS